MVSFGPAHAPLEQRQVARAIEEAQSLVPKPKIIVFAAFQFDPEAAKDIDETHWPGVTLLKAQMNADLLTGDLKKKRASNESFWLIGQPDVEVKRRVAEGEDEGKYRISVQGGWERIQTPGETECRFRTRLLHRKTRSGSCLRLGERRRGKPSDYDGVVYIPFDDSGGWEMRLIRELKSAGYDIDANRAFAT